MYSPITRLGRFTALASSALALTGCASMNVSSGTGPACAAARPTRGSGAEAHMDSEQAGVSRWLQLIQAEYREIPGLNLSKAQMQRFWGLDALVCDALIEALVATRVLRRTVGGAYVVHGAGV